MYSPSVNKSECVRRNCKAFHVANILSRPSEWCFKRPGSLVSLFTSSKIFWRVEKSTGLRLSGSARLKSQSSVPRYKSGTPGDVIFKINWEREDKAPK